MGFFKIPVYFLVLSAAYSCKTRPPQSEIKSSDLDAQAIARLQITLKKSGNTKVYFGNSRKLTTNKGYILFKDKYAIAFKFTQAGLTTEIELRNTSAPVASDSERNKISLVPTLKDNFIENWILTNYTDFEVQLGNKTLNYRDQYILDKCINLSLSIKQTESVFELAPASLQHSSCQERRLLPKPISVGQYSLTHQIRNSENGLLYFEASYANDSTDSDKIYYFFVVNNKTNELGRQSQLEALTRIHEKMQKFGKIKNLTARPKVIHFTGISSKRPYIILQNPKGNKIRDFLIFNSKGKSVEITKKFLEAILNEYKQIADNQLALRNISEENILIGGDELEDSHKVFFSDFTRAKEYVSNRVPATQTVVVANPLEQLKTEVDVPTTLDLKAIGKVATYFVLGSINPGEKMEKAINDLMSSEPSSVGAKFQEYRNRKNIFVKAMSSWKTNQLDEKYIVILARMLSGQYSHPDSVIREL